MIDPAEAARWRAEQTARAEADRQSRAEAAARAIPVTDAELARYGTQREPEPEAEASADGWWNTYLAGVHAQMEAEARDLALRYPVTDAEMEAAAAQPRDYPAPDPGASAAAKADQAGVLRGGREADADRMGRLVPVTDAEVARAAAEPRDYPAPDPAEIARWRQEQAERAAEAREHERVMQAGSGPEATPIDPAEARAARAAQTEQVQAEREARHEAAARQTPVTDAEVTKYGASAEPERAAEERSAALAGLRKDLDALSVKVDEFVQQGTDRAAERRAEMDQAGIDEPVVHEPQAEPSLEASWQPGDTQGQYEAAAEQDTEPEMEIG